MEGVNIWEEIVVIPTYEIGEADKNPIFLEKRVYQGSTGKIYPYPTIDTISDEKVDKEYKAVFLENKYIKVMILPELGGRIQRAYDKTNDYDFVYYNQVIKPALVGLTGPWISGGIEFNWPQHHRPTTFSPVDYKLSNNQDGSKTLFVNDVDQMYGTKGIAGFTLYPDRAYIEIKGQLYNRTPMPQTFLWWANPAIAANEHTQSIFPPDVHAVMDHGKRDVSSFPIATGVYYKHDYSEGVDISRYKNIPVPTSYMAEKSDYDFVGGYDHKLRAGILHVADHHISPGKKQWTWGCGDFGKAWDRNLTDEDGPYIELMTGVFTDNQPDFTWLKPFEEKTFKQYFMPYKKVGMVKNASIYAALNLEKRQEGIYICVYATMPFEDAIIRLIANNQTVLEEVVRISPTDIFETIHALEVENETDLKIEVWHKERLLVEYQPKEKAQEQLPEPAKPAKDPKDIKTNEELYLTGLHIEQYRHATYLPDSYYLEGLARDEQDIRINNAYGALLMRRGLFKEAEHYFRTAIKRLTWKNPNPYNSEPYYNLGLSLFYQEKMAEAFDAFYKASWSSEQQEMSFYYLSAINTLRKEYEEALEFVEKSLIKNAHHVKARGLKAYLLRMLKKEKEAIALIKESMRIDSFDYVSLFELACLSPENKDEILGEMNQIMRNFEENYLQAARDYAEFGAYEQAIQILLECTKEKPLLYYYRAYYLSKLGKDSKELLQKAEQTEPSLTFPNKLEDIKVLSYAINANQKGAKAYYYLGNLYYDKLQYKKATKLWEQSLALDDRYPTVLRNLSLAYYNKFYEKQKAKEVLEKAFFLDTTDARVFLELDQLYKKLGVDIKIRLANYEAYHDTFMSRDDLYLEYVVLHNMLGHYQCAYELLMKRKFHPWEGGEGKVTSQYKLCLIELAKIAIKEQRLKEAKEYLEQALIYPYNLGEGKLEGTKDNDIYYYLGCVMQELGQLEKAKEYLHLATIGTNEPAGMMYYNDQPADMILYQGLSFQKLGEEEKAKARFEKLVEYGQNHLHDEVRIEYFAVSLPDFLIFEEDLKVRNQVHCYYLIGLGKLGFGEIKEAKKAFEKALALDKNHVNCRRFMEDFND